jgi:hypothetical protein
MKLDTQHILLLALAIALAIATSIHDVLAPGSTAFVVTTATMSALTSIGALLKASILPTANVAAAVRTGVVRMATTALVVLAIVYVPACSLFKSGTTTTVVTDVGSIAACVLGHIETDIDPTAESIAIECAPAAVADVLAILTALDQPTDAGTSPASAKAHRILAHRGAK